MTVFDEAVEWLNHFDRSHVSEATGFLLDKYKQASASGDDPDQNAELVEKAARASENPATVPEALILLAQDRYRSGRYGQAWIGLRDAVIIYDNLKKTKKTNAFRQRLAVSRFLAGLAAWKLYLNYTAYKLWRQAKEDLEVLMQNSADEGEPEKEKWYQTIRDIVEVELTCRFEEAYTWLYSVPEKSVRVRKPAPKKSVDKLLVVEDIGSELNIVGMSRMGDDLVKLRNQLVNEVQRVESEIAEANQAVVVDYQPVRQITGTIMDALELRSDINERAEALLECAMARHQIGDHWQALVWMEKALSNYMPGSHQKAVARWMSGILHLQPNSGGNRGFDQFRKSIEEMKELTRRAQTANNQPLVDWYTHKLALMQKATDQLRERLSQVS